MKTTEYYGKKIYLNCTYINFGKASALMTKSVIRNSDHSACLNVFLNVGCNLHFLPKEIRGNNLYFLLSPVSLTHGLEIAKWKFLENQKIEILN